MPKSPSLTRQIQVAQIANPDSRVGWLFGRGRLAVHLERYNPDDLVGRHGLAIYDEMRQDDQVKAALGLKKAAIIGPGWKLDAASDEPADQALRDRIMDDLDRLPGPMSDVLSGLLTGLDYGFALMEMVFLTDAEDGGRLRLAKLQSIAPHGITFDQLPTGDIVAIRQDGNGEAMPPGKFLHYVHMPEFANPYGTSDLRSAHRSWWHKQNWVQWFAVWGEKLADAPILITAAKGASNEEVATARNTAEHLQARTVMTVPEGWAVQLLEQGRDVRSVFLEAIDHHDRQMGKALLVPDKMGMVGGEVQGGSFSLSKTQMGAFLFTIELEQRALEACVQEQLINRIAQFIDPAAEPPTFALLPLAEEDTVAVAQAWQTVLAGGMPETSRDWNYTRMLLGYPEMSQEEVEEAQAAKKQAKRDMARQVAGGGAQAGGGTDDDDEGEDEDEDDRAEDAAALSFNPNQPRVPKGNATGGQWTDGGGGTGDVFARAVPPSAGLKSDDGFVYHATSLDNLVGIVDDGALVPHGPSYGTDQDAWPDGSTARRSYWSANAGVVWQFAPEHGRPVIVRAPATLVPGRESGTGDLFTRKPVPARDLEILTTRGWESVIPDVRLNYDRNQPRVPAGNAHGGRWTDGQGIEQRIAEDDRAEDAAAMSALPISATPLPDAPFWRPLRPAESTLDLAARLLDFEAPARTAATMLGELADDLARDIRTRADKLLKADALTPQAVRDLKPASSIAKRAATRLESVLRDGFERGIQGARDDVMAARADGRDLFVQLSTDLMADLDLAEPGLIGRLAQRFFRAKAFYMAGILEQDLLARVQAILFNAIKGDKPPRVVLLEVDQAVADFVPVRDAAGREVNVPHRLETTARTNLAEAVNEGRFQYFTRPEISDFIRGLEYSAILDDRTRDTHRAWDGIRREAQWWPGPPDRRPPAGFNCRCMLIPITLTNDDPLTPDDALPAVPFPDPGFR